jgi:hypothetical protein
VGKRSVPTMKNPASIPLQGHMQKGPILHIQIPNEEDIQEYRRQQEDRRQQALERLRAQNRALPQEIRVVPLCPSVPRSATGQESLSGSKKN